MIAPTPLFVADSAMLSSGNIAELESLKGKSLSYIVGARLKNLNTSLKSKILDINNYKEITPGLMIGQFEYDSKKLVVSYSAKRARKDAKKIYNLLGIKRNLTPYIIEKM